MGRVLVGEPYIHRGAWCPSTQGSRKAAWPNQQLQKGARVTGETEIGKEGGGVLSETW